MRSVREWLTGAPLPTQRLDTERLSNWQGLAAFSPDALSSVAYANQEIYLGLAAAGAAGLAFSGRIALAIGVLLAIVAASYSQTIAAYPSGGGSFTVASENLGRTPGLLAGAALLVDYCLTAAVSLTAGVEALSSAFPVLWNYRVALSLGFLVLITLANLRGVRESGTLMAFPVYLFLGSFLGMLAVGAVRAVLEGPSAFPAGFASAGLPVTPFLLLHTFAAGCTALTGVEAMSNGVPAFRPPEARNAQKTLAVMAVLMAVLFLGSVGLTQYFGVTAGSEETILSALARRILGSGPFYLGVQVSTLLVLAVAANTSFAGFPRVTSVIAQAGFLPHQLAHLGDRLVYSNGMVLLAGVTGLLILGFAGDTHALIPLFAVGVFLAFTLSQAGMVAHWWRGRGGYWRLKAAVNGVGAAATAVAFLIVAYAKFAEGAWIVLMILPALVIMFHVIHGHYREVARELSLKGLPPDIKPLPDPRVVLPISGVHRGVIQALRFARTISDRVTAVYVETKPGEAEKIRDLWERWGQGVPLEVVPSPYRSIVGPFLDYLDEADREHNDGQPAVVLLPEFVPARWWHYILHNQTALLLRLALIYRRRREGQVRAIIDIPFYLKE